MILLERKLKQACSLSEQCITALVKSVNEVKLTDKEHFSRCGDSVKNLCFVKSGILRVYYLDENGQEWNKHFMQAGDFVASSISPEKTAITNIQALSDVELIKIPYTKLIELSSTYPEIDAFIQRLSFNYLSQKQDREISLLSKQAKHNYKEFRIAYPDLENKISYYHIASYLGITPVQLSRLRKESNLDSDQNPSA